MACQPESAGPTGEAGPFGDGGAGVAEGPMIHRVTAGSPDICLAVGFEHPGCDGNLSLIAMSGPNGTTGQLQDALGGHAVIDCLAVQDTKAWIGGYWPDGSRLIVAVQDNGTSANDPPDRISLVLGVSGDPPDPTFCQRKPARLLRDFSENGLSGEAPQGQVTVE